ncbi:regulator of telomere elongation helicase 1-like [Anneissia japonica]|uniref:regulator of telomere elongation helicase 1-like n=1 Tax=Anneissia japonica TaxID=1529436 RepID=UPI0014256C5D|nr:regulator of telomere elongation helicase 1-like [Anneissia japonica]
MENIKIGGVTVEFPFEPYDCQVDYMQCVIQCLQQKSNAILESPTGTGKTLCLLCACLAWRQSYVANHELEKCVGDSRPGNEFANTISAELKEAAGTWQGSAGGVFASYPKIIYASRTHSQLSQVVQELKQTSYRPKVCVLGSREQMCIHPQVMKQENNMAKVHMCRAKVSARTCYYYNNVENKKTEKDFNDSILDIEDLVKFGHKHKTCPYYIAKEFHTSADIIFMPYNYLLDPKSRRAHGIDLNNNVVIFDEAHNVEKLCEESASFDFSSVELASCIQEVGALLDRVMGSQNAPQLFNAEGDSAEDFDTTALAVLKALFINLELTLQKICDSGGEKGVTKPGRYILEVLNEVHVTMDTKDELIELIEKIVTNLTSNQTAFQNKIAALSKFNDILNIVFSSQKSSSNMMNDGGLCYKVHIRYPDLKQKKSTVDFWASNNGSTPGQKKGFICSYWCFSPGYSMKELVAQGVRSIILTSGTLSPLDSFKSEMQIDFPIQLENPHVIERHQMKVAVVTKGVDGKELNSSYRTRFDMSYIMSLGNTIVNFCRVVPHGLLVFFPSYPVMTNCYEKWQENGVVSRMEQHKQLFIEPKGKTDFVETINGFYTKVQDSTHGAVFFAVCRGKVSEGLDFANNNGRAVLITGLPFPPRMDPKVILKMQYLDEVRSRNRQMLSGQQWYRQQASRAVNQAIGRVIRHKQDYGAIVLCDVRFTQTESKAQLPSWVRPYVKVYEQFGQAFRDINNFFKVAVKTLPKPELKALPPPVDEPSNRMVQEPLRKPSTTSLAKASNMDSLVPSLKKDEVSDACLQNMYGDAAPCNSKAKGLLQALNQAENTKTGEDVPSCSLWCPSKTDASERSGNENKKRKKIVIVNKPTKNVSVNKNHDQVSASVSTAQSYINRVHQALNKENYKQFAKQLQQYKKEEDFCDLISTLATLFTNDESQFPLFRDFYKFVKPHHKKRFSETCLNLTALSCNYKPEHSLKINRSGESSAQDGNKEKRRKLDNDQLDKAAS